VRLPRWEVCGEERPRLRRPPHAESFRPQSTRVQFEAAAGLDARRNVLLDRGKTYTRRTTGPMENHAGTAIQWIETMSATSQPSSLLLERGSTDGFPGVRGFPMKRTSTGLRLSL